MKNTSSTAIWLVLGAVVGIGATLAASAWLQPAQVRAQGQADISINISHTASAFVPGTAATVHVVVSNAGPSAAPGVSIAVSHGLDNATWTCSACVGGNGSQFGADIGAGGSVVITIAGNIPPAATGQIASSASATAATDPDTSNNTHTVATPLAAVGDVMLSLQTSPVAAQPGDAVSLVLTAYNNGPSAASGVLSLSLAAFGQAQWTCAGVCTVSSGSGDVALALQWQPGESTVIRADGAFMAPALLAASVVVPLDPDPANNQAFAEIAAWLPTATATASPTSVPTATPTPFTPTSVPTATPTPFAPTGAPTATPTPFTPTSVPTATPTLFAPTGAPTATPQTQLVGPPSPTGVRAMLTATPALCAPGNVTGGDATTWANGSWKKFAGLRVRLYEDRNDDQLYTPGEGAEAVVVMAWSGQWLAYALTRDGLADFSLPDTGEPVQVFVPYLNLAIQQPVPQADRVIDVPVRLERVILPALLP